jgi:hypothetical protein
MLAENVLRTLGLEKKKSILTHPFWYVLDYFILNGIYTAFMVAE